MEGRTVDRASLAHQGPSPPPTSAHQTDPHVDGPGKNYTELPAGAAEDTHAPEDVRPRSWPLPLAALPRPTQTLGHVALSGPVHTRVDLHQGQRVGPQDTGTPILLCRHCFCPNGMFWCLYWRSSPQRLVGTKEIESEKEEMN